MTNKKRLEEIEKRLSVPFFKLGRTNGKAQLLNDLQWLIEQAERVQELEKQIKRYREALEFYADRENYKPNPNYYDPDIDEYISTIDYDNGATARKALEGEE